MRSSDGIRCISAGMISPIGLLRNKCFTGVTRHLSRAYNASVLKRLQVRNGQLGSRASVTNGSSIPYTAPWPHGVWYVCCLTVCPLNWFFGSGSICKRILVILSKLDRNTGFNCLFFVLAMSHPTSPAMKQTMIGYVKKA